MPVIRFSGGETAGFNKEVGLAIEFFAFHQQHLVSAENPLITP
jgi:hypothetical protein